VNLQSKKNKQELNPNVSVDCVIFGFDLDQLYVLLIDSGSNEAFSQARMAVPGDLIFDTENLDEAATRVLKELTSIENIYLEQIGAFGDPNRIGKKESDREWLEAIRAEPEARVITVAYYSLVRMPNFNPKASSFAKSAGWAPVKEVFDLAFDHYEILQAGLKQLRRKIKIEPIGFNLLPENYTNYMSVFWIKS
jgi:8-oxo-dGTP diphosphatase